MKKPIAYAATLIIALSTNLAVAQDKEKKEEPSKTEKKEEKKADVEITIEGNDKLQYDKTEFSATEGQTVKLTLKNVGTAPKIVMGHNVVILTKGTDPMGFATKAWAAGAANDYMPTDKESKAKVLASTKLLGPGESESITFTAPAAGEYDYICTFVGHIAIMKGKMKVVAKTKDDGAKTKDSAK